MLVRNRETSWRKKGRNERKLEKASREIANKMKKKKEKKKRKQEKKIFIEAKQLAAQLHVWVA